MSADHRQGESFVTCCDFLCQLIINSLFFWLAFPRAPESTKSWILRAYASYLFYWPIHFISFTEFWFIFRWVNWIWSEAGRRMNADGWLCSSKGFRLSRWCCVQATVMTDWAPFNEVGESELPGLFFNIIALETALKFLLLSEGTKSIWPMAGRGTWHGKVHLSPRCWLADVQTCHTHF